MLIGYVVLIAFLWASVDSFLPIRKSGKKRSINEDRGDIW